MYTVQVLRENNWDNTGYLWRVLAYQFFTVNHPQIQFSFWHYEWKLRDLAMLPNLPPEAHRSLAAFTNTIAELFFLIWRPRRIFHPRELVIFEPCFVRYLNIHAYTLTRLRFFRTYFLINSGASTFSPSQHYSNLFLTHIFFNQISNNFLLDQLLLRASNSSPITDVDNSSSVFHPTLENIPIRAKSN